MLLGVLAVALVCPTWAAVHEGSPADYRRLLRALKPGEELRLAPGDYVGGLSIHDLAGTEHAPIVISGPAGPAEARMLARPGRNTISILNSAHVTIKNLVLDGRNLPVDGVKCEGHAHFAHHITLENLTIRGHGNNQQTVGISTKCPAWNWVIRGNTIIGAGTGMYLGNSDGHAPFVAGLIENNLIVNSVGYNLQIKHQTARPELAGMPIAPSETVIRHNVFAKTLPLREDALPRPSVLVGHWPPAGAGAEDRYVIYGNFFYGATSWPDGAESLFQGEGNLMLYNNLFVAPEGDAIRIQPHNDIPKNILVAYNTVLARSAGIVLLRGAGLERFSQVVSHNAVFAGRPGAGAETGENWVGSIGQADRLMLAPRLALEGLDPRPKRGALRRRAPVEFDAVLPGLEVDFDGRRRDPRVAGAYRDVPGPLRWPPALEQMPFHD